MKTILSTTNLIAAAVIGGAFVTGFLAGPAFAQDDDKDRQQFEFRFSYSPHELTSTAKAEKLVARLERRVRAHCGANLKMPLSDRRDAEACVEETMTTQVAKFGSETVAQAYRTRGAG